MMMMMMMMRMMMLMMMTTIPSLLRSPGDERCQEGGDVE
jgi:hypothetical protein